MSASPRPAPGPLSVSEPWDLVSKGYADEAASVMLPFARHAIRLAQPTSSARVLDLATGPGTLALELSPSVNRVDAVDFSPAMLAQLEAQRAALGLDNVFARLADGQALPFEDASFNVVFSMFGLMFFPDRPKGFAEARRVLRPGGVLVVSSWAPVEQSPLMMLMFGALRAADPSRAAPQTNLLSLENPELFAEELEAAGLEDVSVKPYTHGVRVEDANGYWDSMSRASAPIVMLKNRLGQAEWERQSQLAKAYIAEQITEPRELTTTAYLGFGRRPAR
jgi:ubiquinone/menaquinone biosynthesis C-methylase UbiE